MQTELWRGQVKVQKLPCLSKHGSTLGRLASQFPVDDLFGPIRSEQSKSGILDLITLSRAHARVFPSRTASEWYYIVFYSILLYSLSILTCSLLLFSLFDSLSCPVLSYSNPQGVQVTSLPRFQSTLFSFFVQVWFKNRRAKFRKEQKTRRYSSVRAEMLENRARNDVTALPQIPQPEAPACLACADLPARPHFAYNCGDYHPHWTALQTPSVYVHETSPLHPLPPPPVANTGLQSAPHRGWCWDSPSNGVYY